MKDVDSVVTSLQERAAALVVYTSSKQLLIGGARHWTYSVRVGDASFKFFEVIELL